ncbi:fatty-acid peroxygenase [Paractinoplanes abujensis]|uniref:Fatty-acid peroxygenase n=1 Tax=Paractinoplanes abujensis TaxID=882441 RepID=A0A7W7CUG4_9ACTN|nr:cytochrome P450 [Actinoplanes abujensis]MBB4694902.1 fatty-acid peroxygenase [Actinoplanes abujensis]GID23631.1 fatty-acid peroxygenase [Actinoplanes abujensis]
MALLDQTLAFGAKGYAWLPDLRRRSHGRPIALRIGGQSAVAISGPDAARFFYEQGHLERHTALPAPVVDTLFGRGVHTLDGEAHRARKALFVELLMHEDGIDTLASLTGKIFDETIDGLRGGGPVSLFDETARVLSEAAARWTGVPEDGSLDDDLVAMVDGFATLGPRHLRARLARRRRERQLAGLIDAARRQEPTGEPLSKIAHHLENGYLLDSRTAAVELINIIRPTTAVAWLAAFAGHALDRWPGTRAPLRSGDDDYTLAFVHEVRRFYPFAPFLGGRARRDLRFQSTDIAKGTLVLLDVYGQHHDPRVWPEPYEFRPERFLGRRIGEFELIPQGGGDPRSGHRCPGEKITIAVLGTLVQRLAKLDYYLPPQNTDIDLSRVPARPRSGVKIVIPQ